VQINIKPILIHFTPQAFFTIRPTHTLSPAPFNLWRSNYLPNFINLTDLRRPKNLLMTIIRFLKIWMILLPLTASSQSTTLVISQVYSAGGNTGAVYNADYVELHNISSTSQSLSGLALQYASATGNFTSAFALPAVVSIPPGGYYLVRMGTVGLNGIALPATDTAVNGIPLGAAGGKIALVSGTTLLTSCPSPLMIDLVGYGNANCSENTPITGLSGTLAAIRNNNGCAETNNNNLDFTTAAPNPRNSASTAFVCSGGPATPSILASTVNNFGGVTVLTASPSQTLNIFGSNLTGAPGNITITSPSTDFQVSSDSISWGATALVPYASATLSSTPVYVRFTPQATGPKSGNLSINGGGISSPVSVALAGNGTTAIPPSGSIVISQVYGAGGNTGAVLNADYVELHNRSNTSRSLAGYSVQYASPTSTGAWAGKIKLPSVSIAAGGFYLIQMSTAGTIGNALPVPDLIASPAINIGQFNGKVALVSDTNLLYGCPATFNIEDLVGYGSVNCSETSPTAAIDTIKAAFRNNNGCDDTNDNSADFTVLAPAPRNSATAVNICNVTCTANYWTGTVSTAWENAANWSCGSVPDSNSVVYIAAGMPRYPIVSSMASCKKVITSTGATLHVTPGFKLNVLGN
jgi:hypothetical protein